MVEISKVSSSPITDVLDVLGGDSKAEADNGVIESLPAPVRLRLGELLQDVAGEVVLFADSNQSVVEIETSNRVTDRGDVAKHTTASGETVDGYRFVAFDNGVKLYHQDDVDLVIKDDEPRE